MGGTLVQTKKILKVSSLEEAKGALCGMPRGTKVEVSLPKETHFTTPKIRNYFLVNAGHAVKVFRRKKTAKGAVPVFRITRD